MAVLALRGTVLFCHADPWDHDDGSGAVTYYPDGLLVIRDGRIAECGPAAELLKSDTPMDVIDYSGRLLLPGFIDLHVHYAQTKIIGSYGRELLDWLQTYTFPEELKFRSKAYADEVAEFFFDQLLSHGTTSVQSFATTSPSSVHAFFQRARALKVRGLCGLTGIDRPGTAPEEYLDTAESFYQDSSLLIEEYHGQGRLGYSISPRFSFGSTDEQLAAAGRLAQEHPDCWIQTHLSENPREIEAVLEFHPGCSDYLETYERYGLVRKRFCAGHSIYLSDSEFERLGQAEASISFCPTSNLFLGSGFFAWDKARAHGVRWGVGCDSGGGNSLSLLRTLDDAYKVGMIQVVQQEPGRQIESLRMSPLRALYSITAGAARALDLEEEIGALRPGMAADVVVLDPVASPLHERRADGRKLGDSLADASHLFFGCMMLWTPDLVEATYVSGERRYRR